MEFEEDRIPEFLKIFANSRQKIRSFPGCHHLQLFQGESDPAVFFTYSHWDNEDHLNAYRKSKLFQVVWSETRSLFRVPAKAWSLTDKTMVNPSV